MYNILHLDTGKVHLDSKFNLYSLHNDFNYYYNISDYYYTNYLFLAIHTLLDSIIKTSATPNTSQIYTLTHQYTLYHKVYICVFELYAYTYV